MNEERARSRNRWRLMLRRCEDPRLAGYRYYGARGIKVCDRWHNWEAYDADIMRLLGPRPAGEYRNGLPHYTIDRINNDGNYEPANVRWATWREQQLNSRNAKAAS